MNVTTSISVSKQPTVCVVSWNTDVVGIIMRPERLEASEDNVLVIKGQKVLKLVGHIDP